MKLEKISNIEIDLLLKESKVSGLYRGIFSIDNIPFESLRQRKTFIFVCNLSPKGYYGTHFIVIVFSDKKMIYLDTLAPIKEAINKLFILHFKPKTIHYLASRLQSKHSEACGYFCVFFVLYFDRVLRNRPTDFIHPFSLNNIKLNENICIKNLAALEDTK